MNIVYLEHYAGSPEMGMEFRPYYLAKEWVKMGHSVTIFAGDYSHLRKSNPSVTEDFQREMIDGVEYVWIKTGKYDGNGVKRALTMARFVRKLSSHAGRISKEWKPDVVIASSTYPLDTYPAQKIAKKAGCKYIHEVHDMWPSTLYEVGGMSKHNPFVVVMQWAENSAYKHCDKCVSLLPYAGEYMQEHGLNPDKFVNIQNGVVEEEWTNTLPIPEEHEIFFEKHKNNFIVGYFGGHALSNALDYILDIAKVISADRNNNDIIFVLVGEGAEKKRLIQRKENEKIDNLFFLPAVNKRQIPELLKKFDCSYMTGMESPLYRFGLCLNKMYDSMMAGIPVICAYNAPDTIVKKYQCGYQCDPGKQEEVIDAILKIKNMDKAHYEQMSKNGRDAIQKYFTYEYLANRFIETISN